MWRRWESGRLWPEGLRRGAAGAVVLAVLCWLAYGEARRLGFTYDDEDYLANAQGAHADSRLLVHPDVGQAVDSLLRGKAPAAELRQYDEKGEIQAEKVRASRAEAPIVDTVSTRIGPRASQPVRAESFAQPPAPVASPGSPVEPEPAAEDFPSQLRSKTMQLYAFGIPRNRLSQVVRQLGVPAEIVDSLEDADVLITAKAYYRQRPKIISEAEHLNIPIYVLRSNSMTQMENCLADLFSLNTDETTPYEEAIKESEDAVRRVLAGERMVDLSPQNAFVRRQQHDMARTANLVSHSYGKEPYRRVRIFRD